MLENRIIEDLADPQVYGRGKRYFSAGHVTELKQVKENEYRAVVSGTQDYRVRLSLSMGGEDIFSYECNCPAARQSFRACKHVVAAALAVQESQGMTARHNRGNSTSEDPWRSQREAARRKQQYEKGSRMLELFRSHPPLSKAKTQMLRLEPQLFALRSYYDELTLWLEFRIGEEKMYVLKDLASFLRSVDRQEEVRFGKNLLVDTAAMQFEPEISGPVWQMLRDAWHQLNSGRRASYFMMSPFQQKRFMLSSRNLETFFACMGDCPFVFQTEKALSDVGDKIDAAEKEKVEANLKEMKELLEQTKDRELTDDEIDKIKAGKEKLMTDAQALFAKVYEAQGAAAGAGGIDPSQFTQGMGPDMGAAVRPTTTIRLRMMLWTATSGRFNNLFRTELWLRAKEITMRCSASPKPRRKRTSKKHIVCWRKSITRI